MTTELPQRCSECGGDVGPFTERTQYVSTRLRGPRTVYLCENCRQEEVGLPALRGAEFEFALLEPMKADGSFSEIKLEAPITAGLDRLWRADLMSVEHSPEGDRHLVIECKALTTITGRRLKDAIHQLERYKQAASATLAVKAVLALPAVISPAEKEEIAKHDIELWDLDYLDERFGRHIDRLSPRAPLGALLKRARSHRSSGLIKKLADCPAGKTHWSVYQRLVREVLDRLFCPPLSPSIFESEDAAEINRRDIILPNYAMDGFWAYLRDRYAADFIVVDAKNHREPVPKGELLKLLNYLKGHGTGLFGLVVTRCGLDDGAKLTLVDHWRDHHKMIVGVTDADLERMLRAKDGGTPPEEVLRQLIEDFRLGL